MELAGKIVLITGATDGLGKLVASHIAKDGAHVILHGRDVNKGQAVLKEIQEENKNDQLEYYNGDFSSLQDVKSMCGDILEKHDRIDILINNAGIGKGKSNQRELSKDGFELRFAVNYLAPVLLTETLLPVISTENARIINVASVGQAPLDFTNLMLDKNYDGFLAYRQSKAALIMYTFELAERLKTKKTKVNAVHPASLMNTKMVLDDWGEAYSTVEEGAESVENLLGTDVTGEYFDQKNPAKAIDQVYDKGARERLRTVTRELLESFSHVMA